MKNSQYFGNKNVVSYKSLCRAFSPKFYQSVFYLFECAAQALKLNCLIY